MAEFFEALTDKHIDFINNQNIFFVGTAGKEGRVNVSPKGMDSLRVVDESKIVWLNHTGAGNESAAHVLENQRMTMMFCSFDKTPLILRLYGNAKMVYPRDAEWESLTELFPHYPGARQIFEVNLDTIQTSCGFAVPYFELVGERPTLKTWAEKAGRETIEEFWQNRNTVSIDGYDTGIIPK